MERETERNGGNVPESYSEIGSEYGLSPGFHPLPGKGGRPPVCPRFFDLRDAAQSLKNENFRQSFHRSSLRSTASTDFCTDGHPYIYGDGQLLVYMTERGRFVVNWIPNRDNSAGNKKKRKEKKERTAVLQPSHLRVAFPLCERAANKHRSLSYTQNLI